MPDSGSATAYSAGFILSTALLHIVGLIAGPAANQDGIRVFAVVQSLGGLATLGGAVLMNARPTMSQSPFHTRSLERAERKPGFPPIYPAAVLAARMNTAKNDIYDVLASYR